MISATLNPQPKSATNPETVADFIGRGSGRDKVTIAHQFLSIPPYEVELPSHLSLSVGKIALQTWVNRVYPKHVVVA